MNLNISAFTSFAAEHVSKNANLVANVNDGSVSGRSRQCILFRTRSFTDGNIQTRQSFYNAVNAFLHSLDANFDIAAHAGLRDALKLQDYGFSPRNDVAGVVTAGRPLTARRIQAVADELAKLTSAKLAAAHPGLNGRVLARAVDDIVYRGRSMADVEHELSFCADHTAAALIAAEIGVVRAGSKDDIAGTTSEMVAAVSSFSDVIINDFVTGPLNADEAPFVDLEELEAFARRIVEKMCLAGKISDETGERVVRSVLRHGFAKELDAITTPVTGKYDLPVEANAMPLTEEERHNPFAILNRVGGIIENSLRDLVNFANDYNGDKKDDGFTARIVDFASRLESAMGGFYSLLVGENSGGKLEAAHKAIFKVKTADITQNKSRVWNDAQDQADYIVVRDAIISHLDMIMTWYENMIKTAQA